MSEVVVKRSNKLGGRVWLCLILFGLVGQLAWVVENMYFSTFIQKNITKDPWATSATVAASAVVAALTTIFGGALSDRLGKRKVFVSLGYVLWGLTTASFAFFGNEQIAGNLTVAVVAFVVMDCVMTLFGSLSNDAAFSAWVTDVTDITNRGFVDVVLSTLPVAALMMVFVGFDSLTTSGNWTLFFIIVGAICVITGLVGLFAFRDSPNLKPHKDGAYFKEVVYGFTPKNVAANKTIYVCLLGMTFSSLAMQVWQPYMITLIEYTVGIAFYVVPVGIIVLLSAALSVLGGKLMDKYGKEKFFYPVAAAGVAGGLICYVIKFFDQSNVALKMAALIFGGTLIMGGNLMCAGIFNASARDHTPEGKAGCFQGVKIVLVVMLPMVLASLITPFVVKGFGQQPTEEMIANGIYKATDKTYPYELFLFSGVVAALVFLPAALVKKGEKTFRQAKLAEIASEKE